MTWVTTDNVSDEAWRYLLEYANQDIAIEAISKFHGKPDKNLNANYKKQAQQIRASILQAKEYFEAASSSSLITSPNHLYYGMVSLCSSVMLLLGTGDKSLDRLRQKKENNHHGLSFTTNVDDKSCKVGLNILEQSFVEVLQSGFFLQWYSSLPTTSPVYGIIRRMNQDGSVNTNRELFGNEKHLTSEEMVGTRSSVLDFLKYLPDFSFALVNYGIPIACSRIDISVVLTADNPQQQIVEWRIHGAPSKDFLESILGNFNFLEADKEKVVYNRSANGRSCIVKLTRESPKEGSYFAFPSYRETINNELIMFATTQLLRHEIVDAYVAAYGLSMLSRYYPDIWVTCLDSHCKAASVIERLVFILIQKAPIMALSLMRSDDFVISTHRAPWHL